MLISKGVEAVIFDWDGVVIDSMNLHGASWQDLAKEKGRSISDQQFRDGFGMKNERFIKEVLGWADSDEAIAKIIKRKEQLYREKALELGIPTVPGVVQFLKILKQEKVPTAVATSTVKSNLHFAMDSLGLSPYFSCFVAGDDVSVGKPDPEVFLKAADELSILPGLCLVIEDAPAGIEAANAAGMKSLALTTTHSRENFLHAQWVVDRFDDLIKSWE